MRMSIKIDEYTGPARLRALAAALSAMADNLPAEKPTRQVFRETSQEEWEALADRVAGPRDATDAMVDEIDPPVEAAAVPMAPSSPLTGEDVAQNTLGPKDGLAPVPDADINGVIYDPALHSSSRAKNADGTWRARRGGPATTGPKAARLEEQTARDVPPPPPPAAAAVPPPPPPPAGPQTVMGPGNAPTTVYAGVPADGPGPEGYPTFRTMMGAFATHPKAHEIAASLGFPQIGDLAKPDRGADRALLLSALA